MTKDITLEKSRYHEKYICNHKLWKNPLFVGLESNIFDYEDYKYIYSQHYLFVKNFTRYIGGLVASCQDDYLRTLIAEKLWIAGGKSNPEDRLSNKYKYFLIDSFGIKDPDLLDFRIHTKYIVEQYLLVTQHEEPYYSLAFLSLGTESILLRLSSTMLSREKLNPFYLHSGLLNLNLSNELFLSSRFGTTRKMKTIAAIDRSLELWDEYFKYLYFDLNHQRTPKAN
ncbi:MAG: hypothetical protein HRU19_20420 [Pseudobacteriovorax sp.]|nr:hypothetical protein [Pseudobacteriovorax sp.]